MPIDDEDRCGCGALRDRSIAWCGRCHAVHPPLPEPPDPRFVPFSEPAAYRPRTPTPAPKPPPGSRWRSSEITFGPVGRVVMTGLATLPLLFFLQQGVPFGIIGLVVYGGILYPWALRDIWRRARAPRTDGPPAG